LVFLTCAIVSIAFGAMWRAITLISTWSILASSLLRARVLCRIVDITFVNICSVRSGT